MIFKKLLLDPEDEEETIERALSILVGQTGEDGFMTHYQAHIKNLKLFKLDIGQLSLGFSFHLTARKIACVQEELSLGYPRSCDRGKVVFFAPVAAVACLPNRMGCFATYEHFWLRWIRLPYILRQNLMCEFGLSSALPSHCFHFFSLPLYGSQMG